MYSLLPISIFVRTRVWSGEERNDLVSMNVTVWVRTMLGGKSNIEMTMVRASSPIIVKYCL